MSPELCAGYAGATVRRPSVPRSAPSTRRSKCLQRTRCIALSYFITSLLPLSLAVSRRVSRLQNPLVPSMLLFAEGGITIDSHGSATSFYLVVVRVDMEILQEAAQHLSVVVPEDYSLADLASFPSKIRTFVPFDSVLFRKRHHDLVDTVYNEVQCSRWCRKTRSSCCLRPPPPWVFVSS